MKNRETKGGGYNKGAIVVTIVSFIFIFYALSLEQVRMIGDEDIHDPGSRALPLFSGIIMLIAGSYDLYKGIRKGNTEVQMHRPSNLSLFWGTLLGSVIYIVLLEKVGFILLTTGFLYLLFLFYARRSINSQAKGQPDVSASPSFAWQDGIWGGLLALILASLSYGAGRIASRELFYYGRAIGVPLFSSRTFSVFIFSVISLAIFLLGWSIGNRVLKKKIFYIHQSVLLSVSTSLALFIVFRIMFRVALPLGILDF